MNRQQKRLLDRKLEKNFSFTVTDTNKLRDGQLIGHIDVPRGVGIKAYQGYIKDKLEQITKVKK